MLCDAEMGHYHVRLLKASLCSQVLNSFAEILPLPTEMSNIEPSEIICKYVYPWLAFS